MKAELIIYQKNYIKMKVINQYIIQGMWGIRLLYECENGTWYASDTGAFGQRDFSIEKIGEKTAKELLKAVDFQSKP